MHNITSKILSTGTAIAAAKEAGGILGYGIVQNNLDTPWIRWTIYGVAFIAGVRAPLMLGVVQTFLPTWMPIQNNQ